MSEALAAVGLRKQFGGVQAVAGVSLSVRRGELLAMIGPNGAGKSTCFHLLSGQLRPDGGVVRLDGIEITGRSPRAIARLALGRTFQVAAVFASMRVRENVRTALQARAGRVWRPWGAGFAQETAALLARVGMAALGEHFAGQLAYGDLKRLELAMVLAGAPRVLLMDEPTAGMAPAERRALMALVRDLARDSGVAVLFTEHDMDVVFGVADRVLVLDRGVLIAEGDGPAIRADPRVRAIYLGDGASGP